MLWWLKMIARGFWCAPRDIVQWARAEFFAPHEHQWKIRWFGAQGDWAAECTGPNCPRMRFPPRYACLFDEGRLFTDAELDAHEAGGWKKGSV